MKSFLKQSIKRLPYFRRVFRERDQLRAERDKLKAQLTSQSATPWHFRSLTHLKQEAPIDDQKILDPVSWRKYVSHFNQQADIGIREVSSTIFEVRNPTCTAVTKCMLSLYELAFLYMVSKDYYTGFGEIVDLGPLLGLSTNALARGLLDNNHLLSPEKYKRIHSFDLFLRDGYEHFLEKKYASMTGSLFDSYIQLNTDFLPYISISPGDIRSMHWDGKDIEIMFIDVSKSWEINDYLIKGMFPFLIPGKSIVIQQDYIHYYEYWVQITMEYFCEYFELLHMFLNASAVFRCIKKIPEEMLAVDLSKLELSEKIKLMESAREKAPVPVREVMKTAHAKCLYDYGDYDGAIKLLKTVDFVAKTSDPTMEASGSAKSCAEIVNNMIIKKTGVGAF
jgi:hypothetical protein